MKAIWQKARADLWGRRWQSLLILTTVGAAAALLYLGLLTMTTSTAPFDQLMERTHGAHAYFLVSGEGAQGLADRLAQQPEVTASELRPVYESELLFPGREENATVMLQPAGSDQPAIMGYSLVSGRNLVTGRTGEAVLGVSMARYFGIRVGDSVRLSTPSGPQSLTIVGLSADPLWCAYPNCSPQDLYIVPEDFARIQAGTENPGFLLGVRLSDPQQADEFVSRTLKQPGNARISTALSWLTMRLGNQMMQGVSTSSLLMFAVTAVAAAALIIINLIGGAVLAQFREIAVLKVLGFTARQVQGLFAGQNLLLGLLGSGVGVLAGHLTAGRVMGPLAENMGDPGVLLFHPKLAGVVVLLVTFVAGLVTLLAAWPAVVIRPAASLRNGFAAPRSRSALSVRLLAYLRAPAVVILGVKDALARPGRAALTVVSLALCVLTLSVSAGLGRMTEQMSSNLDLLGMPYDLMAGPREPFPLAETERIVAGIEGVETVARRGMLGVMATRQEFSFRLEVMDGDWARLPWQVVQGRMIEGPDEIMLAMGAMRSLGVQVGDDLTLQVAGRTVTWKVVGEYRNPMELGRIGMTSLSNLKRVWSEAKAEGLLIRVRRGYDPALVRQALLDQSGNQATAVLMRTFIAGGFVKNVMELVRFLSILMAVIAALSMLNTALLTAREQMKEVGIRKAMGMTPSQILVAVGAGGAWLGLIGAAIGVPGGYLAFSGLATMIARLGSYGQLPIDLPPFLVALLVLGGTALSVMAGLPAAAWAGRLVTAEALRAE